MNRTVRRIGTFAALLIAVEDEHEVTCTAVLRAAGMSVTKAGHLAAALERIPVLQPKVVVLPASMKAEAKDSLEDRVIATGAEIVWIEPNVDRETLKARLMNAVQTAVAREAQRNER